MTRLLSFLAITAAALLTATALLWASSVGESRRCAALHPDDAAYQIYACGQR